MNIPTTSWSRLYEMADEILALAPWKKCFEEDLFAIQPKTEGPVYFVSIMGSRDEHHALAYYAGSESLSYFRMSQREDIPERIAFEAILLNPHLQLTFEPKRNLLPADLKILKSLGKTYRGKWPAFKSHRPARIPWFPDAQELEEFEGLLEQTLVVLRRLADGEDLLQSFEEEEFFLRRRRNGIWEDSICQVKELPVPQHILKAELPRNALAGISRANICVEADLILMLTPIRDVSQGEAPYLPLMLIMVDAESGFVLGFETISTREGFDAAMVQIPSAITGVLKNAKVIPAQISARHPILLSVLESYCGAYGMKCEFDEDLPAATVAIDSLLSFLRR
ncbi:MAG: DUF7309 domain-containing protein [Terrimicrobiaceae bacterium]